MAGSRFSSNLVLFFNADGTAPAAGGTLTFCVTGTDDLATIYLDSGLADEAQNPLDLDADGRMSSDVFLDDSVIYRVILKDADGNVIDEDDPVSGSDVAAAIAAHNADPASHVTATTTNRGVVSELANDAEAIAKADTSRVLTPSNLAALDASKTFKGFVEQATDAETETGTDDVRYTSPANIQALHATTAEITAAASGDKHFIGPYEQSQLITKSSTDMSCTLPGGLTFKGGRRQSTTDALQTFTFGTAFTNNCYGVILTRQVDEEGATAEFHVSEGTPPTKNGFSIDRDDDPDYGNGWFFFWAWGD